MYFGKYVNAKGQDSRLLLSDVSPQDCDQGQVSW